MIEILEDRRLLSGAVPGLSEAAPKAASKAVTVTQFMGQGVTLNLNTGEQFSGNLGTLSGVSADRLATLQVRASVNWGDGSAIDAGTAAVDSAGTISVDGTHAYSKAGNFRIVVTLTAGAKAVPGQAMPFFVLFLGTITSQAQVARANSSGGATLAENVARKFTASVGTFNAIAPAQRLHAVIRWGDGTVSVGALASSGVVGTDQIGFEVDGTHRYARVGTFPVRVVVFQVGVAGAIRLITTIDSTAVVSKPAPVVTSSSISGTIAGTYSLAPTAVDVGAGYVFNGSGSPTPLGPTELQGAIFLPGFIALGQAHGTLTLTSGPNTFAAGSLTLEVTGPVEPGFSAFPDSLTFVISASSGAFVNVTGPGTIAVSLVNGSQMFSFVFGT